MSNEFIHLHVHSEYSTIDGFSKVEDLAKSAKNMGMSAIALTDHGCLSGSVKHFMACKENGIKPILGIEAYCCPNAKIKDKTRSPNFHLVLLAKNNIGWKNLIKLSSLSWERENFYSKPRIDFELLDKYGEGLIVSSACIAGELADAILKHDGNDGVLIAKQIASKYKERFKDDYYIELMYHCTNCNKNVAVASGHECTTFADKQLLVLEQSAKIAKELNIKSIFTNDSHYINKEDAKARDIKRWIQFHGDKKGVKADESDDNDGVSNELYLKSPEEMWSEFGKDYGDSLERTLEIAEKCDVNLLLGSKAPIRLPEPEIRKKEDYGRFLQFKEKFGSKISHMEECAQYLYFKCIESLQKKNLLKNKEYIDRFNYEMAIIRKTVFAKYFIIIYEFPEWARNNNIMCGSGRGSAAGSLISYLLNITTVDPILFDLPFERFLSAENGPIVERRDLE